MWISERINEWIKKWVSVTVWVWVSEKVSEWMSVYVSMWMNECVNKWVLWCHFYLGIIFTVQSVVLCISGVFSSFWMHTDLALALWQLKQHVRERHKAIHVANCFAIVCNSIFTPEWTKFQTHTSTALIDPIHFYI